MEDNKAIIQNIVTRVRKFCTDILNDKVDMSILNGYNISPEYLEICRNASHPSSKKLTEKLFMHVMNRIGYYERISDPDNLKIILDSIEYMLEHPQSKTHLTPLYMNPIILGLSDALDIIQSLEDCKEIDFEDKIKAKDLRFYKMERNFHMTFKRDYNEHITLEEYHTSHIVNIANRSFIIPANGIHLYSKTINFTQPDDVTLAVDKFHSESVNDQDSYYFRYITKVEEKHPDLRNFQRKYYDIDGIDTETLPIMPDKIPLIIYFYKRSGINYMVVECNEKMNVQHFLDLCFSIMIAFGMLTQSVHLNNFWIVAYNNIEKTKIEGLFFQSLVTSFKCPYEIFTTNVFPILTHIGKRLDIKNGEHRACQLIEKFKLGSKIQLFPLEVFGRLVELMQQYESLLRGIYLILMGASYSLEAQAPIYCVALESISNLYSKIIGAEETKVIKDTNRANQAIEKLKNTLEDLLGTQIITNEEKTKLEVKINKINDTFNSEKLKALLEHYNYPLTAFDKLSLSLRNPLLHGSITFNKLKKYTPDNNLFQLSLNLHKLCCAMALLMAGFDGYIINNRDIYGFPKSGSAFIRIPRIIN